MPQKQNGTSVDRLHVVSAGLLPREACDASALVLAKTTSQRRRTCMLMPVRVRDKNGLFHQGQTVSGPDSTEAHWPQIALCTAVAIGPASLRGTTVGPQVHVDPKASGPTHDQRTQRGGWAIAAGRLVEAGAVPGVGGKIRVRAASVRVLDAFPKVAMKRNR